MSKTYSDLMKLKKGQSVCYYTGFMAVDREFDKELDRNMGVIYEFSCAEGCRGKLELKQVKIFSGRDIIYQYWAKKL